MCACTCHVWVSRFAAAAVNTWSSSPFGLDRVQLCWIELSLCNDSVVIICTCCGAVLLWWTPPVSPSEACGCIYLCVQVKMRVNADLLLCGNIWSSPPRGGLLLPVSFHRWLHVLDSGLRPVAAEWLWPPLLPASRDLWHFPISEVAGVFTRCGLPLCVSLPRALFTFSHRVISYSGFLHFSWLHLSLSPPPRVRLSLASSSSNLLLCLLMCCNWPVDGRKEARRRKGAGETVGKEKQRERVW